MRGVKRCQGSTGRMKKHRYSHEFKVTAVKMANSRDIETKAVADTGNSKSGQTYRDVEGHLASNDYGSGLRGCNYTLGWAGRGL